MYNAIRMRVCDMSLPRPAFGTSAVRSCVCVCVCDMTHPRVAFGTSAVGTTPQHANGIVLVC